jgi:hypothetical protein
MGNNGEESVHRGNEERGKTLERKTEREIEK